MISSDLNQLLKKIKRHRRSSLPRPPGLPTSLDPPPPLIYPSYLSPPPFFVFFFFSRPSPLLPLLSLSSSSPFLSSLLPPHDNESLPCGKGIICGTRSKMPCEPHYRMHDYHDSGAALVSTSPSPGAPRQVEGPPRILPPLSCRYRRGIAETVNQRQGRVIGVEELERPAPPRRHRGTTARGYTVN